MKLTLDLPIKKGDKVSVNNYRTKHHDPELGTVQRVAIHVDETGDYTITYDVALDRKTLKGRVIWLYVGPKAVIKQR